MIEQAFCPHCGAKRPEWAKFCGACGNDYDGPPTNAASAPASPESASRAVFAGRPSEPAPPIASSATAAAKPDSGRPAVGLVVGLVAVLVLLVGLAYVMGWRPVAPSSGPTVNTSNLPPVGVVWFGTSFDPSTFQLSGQSDYAKAGATIAVVAHLSQQVTNGQANVRIEVGSQTILNQAMAPGTTGDVYGFTYSVIIPGSYRVTITNIGGGTLATGVLSVQ